MSPLLSEEINGSNLETCETSASVNSTNLENVAEEKSDISVRGTNESLQQRITRDASSKRCANDYFFWRVLGEGSFSTVFLASDVHSDKEYAIKVCEKKHIIKERKVEYIKREKDVLNVLNTKPCKTAPFFVKLYHTFQDNKNLYFVLSFAMNGELLSYISHGKKFNEICSQFYAAEILRALEHLHCLGIIHRDLKPENILLNKDMHIILTDFGSAKMIKILSTECKETDVLTSHRSRGASFVGTAQYVSPELLNESKVSYASDLWALGCIIYQMIVGNPPFIAESEHEIFQKIKKLDFNFPDTFGFHAKDLVEKLLVLDVSCRLGTSDIGCYTSVRCHEFFSGVNFDNLFLETPPLKPSIENNAEDKCRKNSSSIKPGLDSSQLSRLLELSLHEPVVLLDPSSDIEQRTFCVDKLTIAEILKSPVNIHQSIISQQRDNEWHSLVHGNMILKHGLVNKRKGLISRKRVLILTSGPHLFYADPVSKQLKGEIMWSPELRAEAKNFRIFYIHTPDRTFRWEDLEGNAPIWCEAIEQVYLHFYEKKD